MALQLDRFLQLYYGRDKVLRLWQYTAILCDGLRVVIQSESKTGLLKWIDKIKQVDDRRGGVAAAISSARLVFRLLNTAGALSRTHLLLQNLPSQLKGDALIGIIDFLDICSNLLYNPTEQLMWAGQVNLLNTNHSKLSTWCTKLWIVSIVINIIRVLKSMKWEKEMTSDYRKKTFLKTLTLIQNFSDLVNAVHYLPPGFLWSNQLSPIVVGIMGIISSAIGLYKIIILK